MIKYNNRAPFDYRAVEGWPVYFIPFRRLTN